MDGRSGLHQRWIVLRTRAARETWALENVTNQGFTCYLPRILERQSRNGQKLMVAVPLFPSYLFVLADQWRVLLNTFGVAGVIMRGTEPDALPKRVIEELRAREGQDGFVQLPNLKKQRIQQNSKVRVLNGPFRDHVGVVAGMRQDQRVRILLDFLGRKTDVLIATSDIALAA